MPACRSARSFTGCRSLPARLADRPSAMQEGRRGRGRLPLQRSRCRAPPPPRPPQGGLFALACSDGERIRGVAIIGRPVARELASDDFAAEVTRCCTDGARNACSILYGAAWRAARALGYRRLVTYTLATEGGASLRAAGWACIGEAGGGSWSRTSRPRVDTHPLQVKLRWERAEVDPR